MPIGLSLTEAETHKTQADAEGCADRQARDQAPSIPLKPLHYLGHRKLS